MIRWFVREKLQRLLETDNAAAIGVNNFEGMPDLDLPMHLRGQRTMLFTVGHGLTVPAPVMFDDVDCVITATLVFYSVGVRYTVRIPYECIMFANAIHPSGGNGGQRITA